MSKPILSIDFDGVLHRYDSGWVEPDFIPDPPVDGAIEWLIEASKAFELYIFSSRSSEKHGGAGIRAMMTWLRYWGRKWADGDMDKLSAFNGMWNGLKWPQDKPPAFLIIDDRAITFDGTWPVIETLLAFKPWNKR